MSDYISREELKEEIEKCHITSGVTHQGVWNECVDSILRTIDYMPSADVRENRWVPVSERLPEKAGEYLVTYGSNLDGYRRVSIKMYSPNLHNVDEFDFPDKKRPGWYDYDSEYGHYEWNDVIAWMLLPEPYTADMRGET